MFKAMILCSCFVFGLAQVGCLEMKKSTDDSTCKKLIVYGQSKAKLHYDHHEKTSKKIPVDEFLSMNEIEARQYNDVEFCHVDIAELDRQLTRLLNCKEFAKVSFYDCNFDGCFFIMDHLSIRELIVSYCGVTAEDVIDIFRVDPYTIDHIDLSYNKLYTDEKRLVDATLRYEGIFCATIDVRGNKLSKNCISQLADLRSIEIICD